MGRTRINGDLRSAARVHVIGAFGQDLGEMDLAAALRLAAREGLDLVEVSSSTRPVVCRVLNFRKHTYDDRSSLRLPSPSSEIDLRDSILNALRTRGSDVLLDLDVYVHVSEGRPGVDPGEIWLKPIQMTVRDGVVQNAYDGERLWVTEGTLRIGERLCENMIPLALDQTGAVELRLVGHERAVTVTGSALKAEATAEGYYVDWAE